MISVSHRARLVGWPMASAPAWTPHVDRWYQLDAAAASLVEAGFSALEKLPAPKALFLAATGGSVVTDGEWVHAGLPAPAKFVHTLPSIRLSPLCQALSWQGESFVFQRDPCTLATTLAEAADWTAGHAETAWVLITVPSGEGLWRSDVISLSRDGASPLALRQSDAIAAMPTDEIIKARLEESAGLEIGSGWKFA